MDEEERRAKTRFRELSDRLAELERDRERGRQTIEDAERSLAALAAEAAALQERIAADMAGRPAASEHLAHVEADLARAEQALTDAQGAIAELAARRQAAERTAREAVDRLTRAESQLSQADRELQALHQTAGAADLESLRSRFQQASDALATAESATAAADARASAARDAETKARPGLAEAERASQRLDTEIRTLRKLLDGAGGDLWPPRARLRSAPTRATKSPSAPLLAMTSMRHRTRRRRPIGLWWKRATTLRCLRRRSHWPHG